MVTRVSEGDIGYCGCLAEFGYKSIRFLYETYINLEFISTWEREAVASFQCWRLIWIQFKCFNGDGFEVEVHGICVNIFIDHKGAEFSYCCYLCGAVDVSRIVLTAVATFWSHTGAATGVMCAVTVSTKGVVVAAF